MMTESSSALCIVKVFRMKIKWNAVVTVISANIISPTDHSLTHSLTHSQLLGNIPSEMGNLRMLKTLFLASNELTGESFFINDDDDEIS